MNLFSAIELGKNSILAQQQVFNIIGHNIANVNTDGYSRQIVDLENVRPSIIGYMEGGRGVSVIGIRSVRDQFIDSQIVERKQYEGYYDTLSGIMLTIDSLFDESSGYGLSDTMSNFFNAWADVANNPTDIPTRNSLVSQAQVLSDSMSKDYDRLTDEQQILDANVAVLTDEINSILHEIAGLNEQIAYAEGSGNPANDLLDTRERALRDLADKVGINFYYEQSNHSLTIEIAGRPVVSFNEVNELSVQRNQYNSNYYDLYIDQNGTPTYNITTQVINGEMGALILARDGRTVTGTGTVTGVSAGGYTTLTFSSGDHNLSVGDLITVGGETRSVISIGDTDEVVVADFTAGVPAAAAWQEREGFIPEYKKQLNKLANGIIMQVNNAHQAGYGLNDATAPWRDFFQMNPAVAGITVNNVAGNAVTFSADVSTYLSVGDLLTIDGETRLITQVNGANVTVDTAYLNGSWANWEYSSVFGAANGMSLNTAIEADSTLIAASSQPTDDGAGNPLAVGNNDIALQIAQLLEANNVVDTDNDGVGDYGTFHEYLHSLYSEVGNEGSTATYELDANGSMLTYLENKRDSISGVSLDEEAATLMQFEKSYQAIAQFMGTVSDLTDVLMNIV